MLKTAGLPPAKVGLAGQMFATSLRIEREGPLGVYFAPPSAPSISDMEVVRVTSEVHGSSVASGMLLTVRSGTT